MITCLLAVGWVVHQSIQRPPLVQTAPIARSSAIKACIGSSSFSSCLLEAAGVVPKVDAVAAADEADVVAVAVVVAREAAVISESSTDWSADLAVDLSTGLARTGAAAATVTVTLLDDAALGSATVEFEFEFAVVIVEVATLEVVEPAAREAVLATAGRATARDPGR